MEPIRKKLPFLKKDSKESHLQIKNDPRQWDNEEAHFSGSRPSSSLDSQRTTQVLPLLVRSSPAPLEIRKKVQPPSLVLPDLAQRATARTPLRASQVEIKPGLKEPLILPRVSEKERSLGRKLTPEAVLPFYPELSDECFQTLWENKKPLKGRSVKEVLDMMDEREILETILDHLRPFQLAEQISSDPKLPRRKPTGLPPITQKPAIQQSMSEFLSKDKITLYKYFGIKLRNSKQKDLVTDQLKRLLSFSLQEETDREGISETIRMVAFCHLPEILEVLKEAGHSRQPKTPFKLEASTEDAQTLSERQIRTTLILCYGQAVLGAQAQDVMPLMDDIVSEILSQYSTMNKDEGLKTAFMRSIIMITKAVAYSRIQDVQLPHKQQLVINTIEVIEDEPVRLLSVVLLHQAIITITCMSRMKPAMNAEVRSQVVSKSIQRVFSLPAIKTTTLNAKSLTQSSETQDFYHQTASACNTMVTGLLSETPDLNALQEILMHTNPWVDSPKSHERERAIKTTRHLLKFVSENVNFDTTADFHLLGELVALLALHIGDSSKEVGKTSAEAAYHLHHLIMSKMAKEMDKKPKNKKGNIVQWLKEDFFDSGPAIFYNNVSKMAKAFGEYLSPTQITDLILKALEGLTHWDRNISITAGLLLNSFLDECGMEIEELAMILKEIYTRLPNISDPATKEEILKAVCHLASKRVNKVVDILLECSITCDGSARELWRSLALDPYANMKIMKPLLKRLQNQDPTTDVIGRRNSKSTMPIAATNALCYILSLPEAADTLQNKFPNLLIALITQLYFLLGASKTGCRRPSKVMDISEQINFVSTAVQAIKNLILCAGYQEEYNDLGKLGCWDMLFSPDSLFEAVFHMVRKLFSFSKLDLKVLFRQANTYLHHPDLREKTIGMVFFSELLYHPEVGHFFMIQDILDVLLEWMAQPYPLIQIFSIRGLGYLLQHPFEKKLLEPALLPVVSCAGHSDKGIAKEALRTLQFLFRHLGIDTYGCRAVGLIPLLVKYFSDEDTELRNSSITIFGMLLRVAKETASDVTENVLHSLVPLFIQLSNDGTKEISRNTLKSCTSFLNWEDIPSNLFDFEIYASVQNMYSNICLIIMNKCLENMPEMLLQMMEFLRSRKSSLREAAALLIGCCGQYMKPDIMSSKQIEEVFLGLQKLQGDSEGAVAQAAANSMEEIFRQCGHRINPELINTQLLSKVITSLSQTKQ